MVDEKSAGLPIIHKEQRKAGGGADSVAESDDARDDGMMLPPIGGASKVKGTKSKVQALKAAAAAAAANSLPQKSIITTHATNHRATSEHSGSRAHGPIHLGIIGSSKGFSQTFGVNGGDLSPKNAHQCGLKTMLN